MGRRRKRRPLRRLAAYVAMAALAGALALSAGLLLVYPRLGGEGARAELADVLPEGASLEELAAWLERGGAVRRGWLWALYARLRGADEHLRAGRVYVARGHTPEDVLFAVAEGFGRAEVRVTVPEGFTRYDVARRLARLRVSEEDAFLRATEARELLAAEGLAGPTAEGFLFPDTYHLRQFSEPAEVVAKMTSAWRRRTQVLARDEGEALARLRAELGWGWREITTLASIVEREAAVADERPIIAGVFLNRLRAPEFRPKRLQADPTVSYGCLARPPVSEACARFDGARITSAMLADAANPYNTYRREGLPPGPIANPGLAAIGAVLRPAEHRYFYFVARGGGRHTFSETLEAHHAAQPGGGAPATAGAP